MRALPTLTIYDNLDPVYVSGYLGQFGKDEIEYEKGRGVNHGCIYGPVEESEDRPYVYIYRTESGMLVARRCYS